MHKPNWSLKKAGIEIEIFGQDNSTFLSMGREDAGDQWQDVQLYFQSFIGGPDPHYAMTWWITEQKGLWNWERFRNGECDQLNDLALASSDDTERDRYYQRMQDLMEESGCYRFITQVVVPNLYNADLEPAFMADGSPLFHRFRRKGKT